MPRSPSRRAFTARAALAALAPFLPACRPGGPLFGTGPVRTSAEMRFSRLRQRYAVEFLQRFPVTSTYLGGDGWSAELSGADSRYRDWSPGALTGEARLWRELLDELASIHPARLAPALAVDQAVMSAQLGFSLRARDRKQHLKSVDTYLTEAFRGLDWLTLRGEEARAAMVARLSMLPEYFAVAAANLEEGAKLGVLPDHRLVEKDGLDPALALGKYLLESLPRLFPGAAVEEPARRAAVALDQLFAKKLVELYREDKTDRFAAGEEEYAWRLSHCLALDLSPQQVFEHGKAEVARYEEEARGVAAGIAKARGLSDAGLSAVFHALSEDHPKTDRELFGAYREVVKRAIAYGRERGLFEVPADYSIEIVETPPPLRSSIDAAYYPAPAFRHDRKGQFYLTPTGDDPAALRLTPFASVADTAVHEGFPGHDWNYTFMNAHAAEIHPVRWLLPGAIEDSSAMWADSVATEGWALYAEELMAAPAAGKPHGFYSEEEYFFELQGQILRAARLVIDAGIHTGRMGWEEAEDYYALHVDFTPDARRKAASGDKEARAVMEDAGRAVYRYSKWPTQAITYLLGKEAIVSLREAARARKVAAFSERGFHEDFMRMGPIPPGRFREAFLAAMKIPFY